MATEECGIWRHYVTQAFLSANHGLKPMAKNLGSLRELGQTASLVVAVMVFGRGLRGRFCG